MVDLLQAQERSNKRMSPIRILIADDHEIFRRGLRSLLESHAEWEVCGEAIDGQEAVERVKELNPDVVVLDITMPRLNGLEATQMIRNEAPRSKVVILSQHETSLMRQAALNVGASAYVTKSEVSRELMMAIEEMISSEN
jgi:DNA-binding NarL/FixJ family response regulator